MIDPPTDDPPANDHPPEEPSTEEPSGEDPSGEDPSGEDPSGEDPLFIDGAGGGGPLPRTGAPIATQLAFGLGVATLGAVILLGRPRRDPA